jgi:hypothetical protein
VTVPLARCPAQRWPRPGAGPGLGPDLNLPRQLAGPGEPGPRNPGPDSGSEALTQSLTVAGPGRGPRAATVTVTARLSEALPRDRGWQPRHLQVAQVILGNIELNITQYLIEY